MRLDDSVIGHVAKLIQLAILTGTDIVDHMRMIRFAEDDNVLFLDEEYKSNADSNIQSMLDQIETLNPGEEWFLDELQSSRYVSNAPRVH